MDPVKIHLALGHFPLSFILIGFGILLYALIKRSQLLVNIALTLFLAGSLISIAVYLSGEGSEETIKEMKIQDISDKEIHEHKEQAETTIWFLGILGTLSLMALFLAELQYRWMLIVILAFSLITLALIGITAGKGGEIRHSEIRR